MKDKCDKSEWRVMVNSIGAFEMPYVNTSKPGNYRLRKGDILHLVIPSGNILLEQDLVLQIKDFLENSIILAGQYTLFGDLIFTFNSEQCCLGPCHFIFQSKDFDESNAHNSVRCKKTGVTNTVLIESDVTIASKEIPGNALSVLTIPSHLLGTIDTWTTALASAAYQNYNVIHLTPIQTPGESGSCYSLAEHEKISPCLLPSHLKNAKDTEIWSFLQKTIQDIEKTHGLAIMCDLVLNHVASNSSWLRNHPEAGYNVENCPHLQGAIELDILLQNFSQNFINNKFQSKGITNKIENEDDLNIMMNLLQEEVLDSFFLEEWFEIPIDDILNDLKLETSQVTTFPCDIATDATFKNSVDIVYVECLKMVGIERNCGVRPKVDLLTTLLHDMEKVKLLLQTVQKKLYEESKRVSQTILESLKGFVRYEQLERQDKIEPIHSLFPAYFTAVKVSQTKTMYLANNGWVCNWDPQNCFVKSDKLIYLSRCLNVWSDCVKLRYGDSARDSPFLWQYMSEYCERLASLFFGVRLDNVHSTPSHVAKFFLKKCRRINPSLWIFAELFSGNEDFDYKFEREVGINVFLRESLQSHSCESLAYEINNISKQPIGYLSNQSSLETSVKGEKRLYKDFVPTKASFIFYDCTHDNQVPAYTFTAIHTLNNTVAVSLTDSAIGSTRGYDELIPWKYNIATEKRHFFSYSINPKKNIQKESMHTLFFKTKHKQHLKNVDVFGSWDNWDKPLPLVYSNGEWCLTVTYSDLFPLGIPFNLTNIQYKFCGNGNSWFYDIDSPTMQTENNVINNCLDFRNYNTTSDWEPGKTLPGIMELRRILNALHFNLVENNFIECSATVLQNNILLIERHNPATHQFCLTFSHCAFSKKYLQKISWPSLTFTFTGRIKKVLLEANLFVPLVDTFENQSNYVNGLPSLLRYVENSPDRTYSLFQWFHTSYTSINNKTTIQFTTFPPGTVFIFLTEEEQRIPILVKKTLFELNTILDAMFNNEEEIETIFEAFSYLLYSCSVEEKDLSNNRRGSYVVPRLGELPYAGIAGVVSILDSIRFQRNNQGNHPLLQNIVEGNWLFDFLVKRLNEDVCQQIRFSVLEQLWKISLWMKQCFQYPSLCLRRELLPYYFDLIICTLYREIINRFTQRCFPMLPSKLSDPFISLLCGATLQFYSYTPSVKLACNPQQPTHSAGLPFFATDWMRCWGRDTFVSFKGNFLVTKRWSAAKGLLLCFGQVVRYGLIPNLLGSQKTPRYNARDVTWFYIQAIKDFCSLSPEGNNFLTTEIQFQTPLEQHSPWILKCFPHVNPPFNSLTFAQLIHYIMSSHVFGIQITESNVGGTLDKFMKPEGLHITAYVDKNTGFVYGGNKYNCGTWMDKMGSSKIAGNIGVPATPRDGAAVEINGLVHSALQFVNSIPQTIFQYTMIDDKTGFTYALWEKRLTLNFEKYFFTLVKFSKANDEENGFKRILSHYLHSTDENLGSYKDIIQSSTNNHHYQLRPNYCIAQAVAPELFCLSHMKGSLHVLASRLIKKDCFGTFQQVTDNVRSMYGDDAIEVTKALCDRHVDLKSIYSLGVKTLDSKDPEYNGYYNNDDNSTNKSVAHGFNYHNGPEWLWLLGYFLMAKFQCFLHEHGDNPTQIEWHNFLFDSMQFVQGARYNIMENVYRSLPELTNEDGQYCPHSCTAQSWSIASLLSFLSDVYHYSLSKKNFQESNVNK